MATVKQIKEWIPQAIDIFTTYFPLDFIPEIHIANEKDLITKRNKILSDLESETARVDRYEYDSALETIMGKNGWAILINQKAIPTPSKNPNAAETFYHFLWHELGHFLAIKSETTDLHRFNNPGLADPADRAKQEGYWFWSEFIAESIANHVSVCWRKSRKNAVYRPDLITWEPRVWNPIADKLVGYLDDVFQYYGVTIDEYMLGIYFAYLLKDDFCQLYVKAAENCELMVDNWPFAPKKMEAGDVDATAIVSQDEIYGGTLHEMKAMLEEQLAQDKFYLVDEDWIQKIGEKVVELNTKKQQLISGATDEEAAFISELNAMSPAERERQLREQMGDKQYEAMMRWAMENPRK